MTFGSEHELIPAMSRPRVFVSSVVTVIMARFKGNDLRELPIAYS